MTLAVAAYAARTAVVPASASLIISTFAGGGAGDGKNALLASLIDPSDVAEDAAGNLYVADTGGRRIRKIDAAGTITTIAGDGAPGYAGDGGPASAAQFNSPTGIAFDSAGNLYVADTGNSRVRRIDGNGLISTVAGNGTAGFQGDGGPATAAELSLPRNLTVASDGSIYIADYANNRIRRVDPNGTMKTVVGSGTAGYGGDGGLAQAAKLSFPNGVALDKSGNLYIADGGNHRVRKVNGAGIITTVAGTGVAGYSGDGGAASDAQLDDPTDVGFDALGNLHIADGANGRIRKVDANGIITTIAGGGPEGTDANGNGGAATAAHIAFPKGLGFGAGGVLYIADSSGTGVRKVDAAGIISTAAGNGQDTYCCDGDSATSVPLANPTGVIVGNAGEVYLADIANHRIRKVDASGHIHTIAGTGSTDFSGDGGLAVSASLNFPEDIALDASGNLYVADSGDHRVRKIDAAGIISTIAGTGISGYSGDGGAAVDARLKNPYGLAVDSIGNVYVSDKSSHSVRKISLAGIITTVAGTGSAGLAGDGGPGTQAQLDTPQALAFDSQSGDLYIADSNNNRIRKIDSSGTITTFAGSSIGYAGDGGPAANAKLNSPEGVAVDPDGSVYIVDTSNDAIRKVDTNGIITTVAGNGHIGFSGDGGPAAAALLNTPSRIAVDAHGVVYFSDSTNGRIRLLSAAYTLGGTASGLVGTGFTLNLNDGAHILTVSANGSFTFLTALADGTAYSVAVTDQPKNPRQTCKLANGTGTIAGADVTSLIVTCTTNSPHTVTLTAHTGGTISPSGTQTVLEGDYLPFSVTPDPGYRIADVTGCGTTFADGAYSTGAISADCTVVATFVSATAVLNGECGKDDGKTLIEAPTNLCKAGTPSVLSGNGPWTWSCQGSNGGTNASCSAQTAGTTPSYTSLVLTPNPAIVGQSVVATVSVTETKVIERSGSTSAVVAATPGGSVTVSGGGRSCTASLANGSGSCTLVFGGSGSFVITATYSGDATHAVSTFSRTITVNATNASNGELASAPALDRWALVAMLLSLLLVAARRRRQG